MGKKIKKVLITTGLLTLVAFSGLVGKTDNAPSFGGITAYASEVQVGNQWEGSGDIWRLKTAEGIYVSNSWVDDGGSWYLLDEQGFMRTDLIYDNVTNAYYMLNPVHDGTYGRMLDKASSYKINSIDVYLEFNQSHDGTYGKIITGLDGLKATGVKTTTVNGLPSASVGGNKAEPEQKPAETKKGEDASGTGTGIWDNMTEEDWANVGGATGSSGRWH